MILMSGALLGDVPFKTVYLHGLVLDKDGKKMSKSLGNIIDPVEGIEKFGADAVRMALLSGTGAGNDTNISENKIKGYKHFANKIWNISRFVLENTKNVNMNVEYVKEDAAIRKRFEDLILKNVTKDIEAYRLHLATEIIYQYTWHEFADIILTHSKTTFLDGTDEEKESKKKLLISIFIDTLKLLHPFMPFITEEIWGMLQKSPSKKDGLLLVAEWPFKM